VEGEAPDRATDDASGEGGLRGRLALALGDPALAIAYWLSEPGAWVDATGHRLDVGGRDPDRITIVEDRGQPVAALLHSAGPVIDRELVGRLTAAAGLALENERLSVELRARLEEQATLRRVATLVAEERSAAEVFEIVTTEVARLLDGQTSNMVRFDDDGARATVLAGWSEDGVGSVPAGTTIVMDGDTALTRVVRTGGPVRVDSYDGIPGALADRLRNIGIRASVAAPIFVEGRLWGAVLTSTTSDPFPASSEVRLGAFAALVAQAVANADARRLLTESRARIVQAGDEARRRIERDLHDGAQQHLVGIALSLRMARSKVDDPVAAAAAIDACSAALAVALEELRELARGIHPAVLTERGLDPALHGLADRAPVPVTIDGVPAERLPPAIEAALYFVASEALANVAKYAAASAVTIRVAADAGSVGITIADDGVGGADPAAGTGLRGLVDRVEALGGSLEVLSPAGGGTSIRATLPSA
jgi:signal transduction histidine kinase